MIDEYKELVGRTYDGDEFKVGLHNILVWKQKRDLEWLERNILQAKTILENNGDHINTRRNVMAGDDNDDDNDVHDEYDDDNITFD